MCGVCAVGLCGGVEGVEARMFDQHQESSDLKLREPGVCAVCAWRAIVGSDRAI